jgi:hypothetical protein
MGVCAGSFDEFLRGMAEDSAIFFCAFFGVVILWFLLGFLGKVVCRMWFFARQVWWSCGD